MTLHDFLGTWRGLQWETRFLRIAVVGLVLANLGGAYALVNAERTVVLVPPVLEGEVNIARDSASQEVREAWALYIAQLLGNATPATAPILERVIEPLLAPRLRQPVMTALSQQVGEIQRERVRMDYQVRAITHDPKTNRVYISGTQTTTGPGGNPKSQTRTYEFDIAFRNFRPTIEHIDVYAEEPRVAQDPS